MPSSVTAEATRSGIVCQLTSPREAGAMNTLSTSHQCSVAYPEPSLGCSWMPVLSIICCRCIPDNEAAAVISNAASCRSRGWPKQRAMRMPWHFWHRSVQMHALLWRQRHTPLSWPALGSWRRSLTGLLPSRSSLAHGSLAAALLKNCGGTATRPAYQLAHLHAAHPSARIKAYIPHVHHLLSRNISRNMYFAEPSAYLARTGCRGACILTQSLVLHRQICEELAKVGTADQVAVTQQQLTELEPMLRYSQYQLQRRGKGAADALVPDSPSASALQVSLCMVLVVA